MQEVTGKLHLEQTQLAHSKTQNELQIRDTVAKYESIAVVFKENDNFSNEGQDIVDFRLTHSGLIVFILFCLQQFAAQIVQDLTAKGKNS